MTKFTLVLIASTATCTAAWQSCVSDVLYHCRDPLWLDYLQGPGGWVHGAAAGQPGSFGDTLRPGWSVGRLDALWGLLLGAGVVVSLILSQVRGSRATPDGSA